MCGICGIVTNDPGVTINQKLIEDMTETLRHRGPDDVGTYNIGGCALGMRRLSIIDLNTGAQPITNEDGKIVVVCNGEIYNYKQLREDLEKLGHRFDTNSDVEVLVHLYEEKGPQLCKELDGMFAFALWDSREKRLLVGRDPLGIKPLYICVHSDQIIVASEIKAILKHPVVSRDVDPNALADYLTFNYIHSPRTIFNSIQKLSPGCIATYCRGRYKSWPYYQVPCPENYISTREPEVLEHLDSLIREAVKKRLMSDVPFGALLSGGIDSSLVVAYMAQLGGEKIKTFSVGFEEDQFNELPMSRLVANKFGLESHEIIVRPDVLEVLPLLATQFDEPFGDTSAVPSFYVSQVAREHVKMCLSGDGGDELFAGYKRYAKALKFSWYDNCPSQLKKLAGLASRKMSWNVPGKHRLRWFSKDFMGRYIEGAGMVSDEFREELFQKENSGNYGLSEVEKEYRERVAKCANSEPLTMMAYSDLRSYLPENNLTKVDRSSMLNSLEVRVPLIDLEVVDYALQIPPELLMQKGQTKSLLRKLASRYLPSEVVNAGKRGFAVPVDAWLRGELSATVEDTLGNPNGHIYEYLDFQTVSQFVRVHQDGRGEFGHILWALMMFEMWAREYLENG